MTQLRIIPSRLRHSGRDPESPRTPREGVSFPVDKGILNRVQDDRTSVIPDPDPESPRTLREGVSFPVDKGILNRVQDDGGATACAASLRSDRFGSDATNDKQLSLATRVSHSGPDPESHRRSGTFHHGFVGFGGIRPTIPRQTHSIHSPHQTYLHPAPEAHR